MAGTGNTLPDDLEAELMAIHFGKDGTARQDLVETLCLNHPEHAPSLRKRLEALARSDRLLGNMRDGLRDLVAAQRIGPYEIVRVLGEGGFGTVYLAEQQEPVRREVALKVLQAGHGDTRSLQRFEDERQVLARLHHACIAQVSEAGVTEDRLPFCAMEYVDGPTITDWCNDNDSDIAARLQLFVRVCRAIHHAHQCEVVHRDIKPSNILVRDEDGAPLPKVIDFGIAKMLGNFEAGREATIQGGLVGTPGYMSPEQAAGEPVDARTDVYSLGVLLCELLTGTQPLARERLVGASIGAMARILEEETPRRPSTLLPDATASHALRKRLREDLDWIVLQAVATSRDDRYSSVAAMADDVERHLRGEAVLARQNAGLYVFRKFVRRHRLVAAAAGLIAISLVGVITALSWGLGVATEARADAESERDTARARERASRMAVAQMALASGDVHTAVSNLAGIPDSGRGWEWRHLVAQSDTSLQNFTIGTDCLNVLWLDDDHVVTLPMFAAPAVWQLSTGEQTRTIEREGVFRRVAHHSASKQAILAGDAGIGLWDLATGQRLRDLGRAPDEIWALAASPDLKTAALSGRGRWLDVLDTETGLRKHRFRPPFEASVLAMLGADRLVSGSPDGTIRILSLTTGETEATLSGHSDVVTALLVDQDNERLYSSSFDGTVRAWRLTTHEPLIVWRTRARMRQLQLAADGRHLYACGGFGDCVLAAWDTDSFELAGRYHGHELGVIAFEIDPTGERIASVSRDGTLRTWPTELPGTDITLPAGQDARVLSTTHDGSKFATASFDGRITVWNAHDLDEVARIDTGEVWTGSALTADTVFAVGPRLDEYDLATGALRASGTTNGRHIERMLLDPAGRWIAGGYLDHLLIWRRSDLALLHDLELPVAASHLAWDPRTDTFVVGCAEATVRWIDPVTGTVTRESRSGEPERPIGSLAFRDGLLATGTEGVLSVTANARPVHRLNVLHSSAAIAPDGQRLATGGADQKVRIWDLNTGDQLLVFDQPVYPVTALHFVDDGNRLIALSHRWGAPTQIHVFTAPATARLKR